MADPRIKIEKLRVVYDKGMTSEMVALNDISLEIYPEEYVIFFGPSGCGKSTLLYTIAGLEVPESGHIILGERDLASLSKSEFVAYHRSQMGMVFQAFYLIPSLSVLDNVVLPQMFLRERPAQRRERGMKVLERFEIDNLAKRLPTELSGGQQQRVSICRAVINDPPLLFADEPVGNLDSHSSEKVMDLLYELNTRDKKTVILVTHDSRYLHYAHRVFYLKDGELVREVSNPERTQVREEKVQPFVAHALADFARFYPHLDENNLKAKFLCHYLLDIKDEEIQERLEHLVGQRYSEQISRADFVLNVNKSFAEGGVGLYEQTAHRIADELDKIIEESKFVHVQFEHFPKKYDTLLSGLEHVRNCLLADYEGTLSSEVLLRFNTVIKARLEGSVDHKQFRQLLIKPWKDGGLGLHHQTAERFSKRLELILINYPHVVGTVPAPEGVISNS